MSAENIRPMTEFQTKVWYYLVAFFKDNDQLPPVLNVANHFGKYENQIQETLVALSKRGLIEKNAVGKWRFKRDAS